MENCTCGLNPELTEVNAKHEPSDGVLMLQMMAEVISLALSRGSNLDAILRDQNPVVSLSDLTPSDSLTSSLDSIMLLIANAKRHGFQRID